MPLRTVQLPASSGDGEHGCAAADESRKGQEGTERVRKAIQRRKRRALAASIGGAAPCIMCDPEFRTRKRSASAASIVGAVPRVVIQARRVDPCSRRPFLLLTLHPVAGRNHQLKERPPSVRFFSQVGYFKHEGSIW